MRRILGIDPGSVVTGYGVIDSDGVRDFHVANGSIKVLGDNLPEKLGYILKSITDVIEQWQPTEVAIESVFVSKNVMSALKLGQARGAAICAAVQRDLPVAEYAPKAIKQAAVGYGSADKSQMQEMIRLLLSLEKLPKPDAADGLAIAICHAHTSGLAAQLSGAAGGAASTRTTGGKRRAKRWMSIP